MSLQVGEFFTMHELVHTDQPMPNEPEVHHIINMTRLVNDVLDPLRLMAGPLIVNSCFRSEPVNRAVGGAANSFHRHGLAADIRSDKYSPKELALMLGGLAFDKAIDEFDLWLHVQIPPIGSAPRGQLLQARKDADGKTVYRELR